MILIFGKTGQVGSALGAVLGPRATVIGAEEADLADTAQVVAALDRYRPKTVINAAAYTMVDPAETDRTQAYAINAEAPGAMAEWCKNARVPFIHFSTDYVFNGQGNTPWREEDAPHPISVYGATKRSGEEAVLRAGGNYRIFRTSWIYAAEGKNFVNTMLRLGKEKAELRVVADQIGAPTYATHLAAAVAQSMENTAAPSGIYHLCNSGETSWHGFAEAIFTAVRGCGETLAVQHVKPITTAEYPTPAKRPLNSRLDCSKAKKLLGITMPSWQEGLAACMKVKYENSSSHIPSPLEGEG